MARACDGRLQTERSHPIVESDRDTGVRIALIARPAGRTGEAKRARAWTQVNSEPFRMRPQRPRSRCGLNHLSQVLHVMGFKAGRMFC